MQNNVNSLANDGNPLLSEFDWLSSRMRFLQNRWLGIQIASFAFFHALIAALLAIPSGANCVRMVFQLRNGSPSSPQPIELVFGYWAEMNHAFFHILGVPLFILAAYCFLSNAGIAFKTLTAGESGVLHSPKLQSDDSAFQLIKRWNRKLFVFFLPMLAIFAAFSIWKAEFSIDKNSGVSHYSARTLGWVQASEFATDWANIPQKGKALEDLQLNQAPQQIIEHFMGSKDVVLSKVTVANDLPRARSPFWRKMFFAAAFSHQWFFYTLLMWVALKSLFFLLILTIAFRNCEGRSSDAYLAIRLRHDDKRHRFGLSDVDAAYRSILWMVVIGGVGVLLMKLNSAKNGGFVVARDPEGIRHAVAWSIAMVVFFVVIVLPVVIFQIATLRAKAEHAESLDKEWQAATSEEEKLKIQDKQILAAAQVPWPKGDTVFKALVVTFVGVVLCTLFGPLPFTQGPLNSMIQITTSDLPNMVCPCSK